MTYDVFEKINDVDRENWHLNIDAIYRGNPLYKNYKSEVLSKLLGVKNQGGFRYLGSTSCPNLIVLYSTGKDEYWRDELDNSLGYYIYYGDNKEAGADLHTTSLHGNEILRDLFELASSDDLKIRKKLPPILVFSSANESGYDVKFLGLAVPGIKAKPEKEWLTALWAQDKSGNRFQNYKAYFTILDTSKGCTAEKCPGINLAWLNDILIGKAYDSKFAPFEWKKYINQEKYRPLIAKKDKIVRSKEEQLPGTKNKTKMLDVIHDYFIAKDRGYSFEQFAADIVAMIDDSVVADSVEVTKPYKDGGFDAVGKYRIFKEVDNSVNVEFYLQAKCYAKTNPVTVKDTSRLISRIKNRQFGIMVTTSYVANQAYSEILEDHHPIVIITGKDIVDYIYDELGIHTLAALKTWLKKNY